MPFPFLSGAAAACFIIALLSCAALRHVAVRHALVDRPNERSLHQTPVPRLGGVGIVLGAWLVVLCAFFILRAFASRAVVAWMIASMVIAAVGLLDDMRPLHARTRFLIQGVVVLGFIASIGLPSSIALFEGCRMGLPGFVAASLVLVFVLGTLNIYNFMDGMDGLAGAQGVGAGVALAAAFATNGDYDLALIACVLAAGCAGFLVHNMPPATLFMGDVGSTFCGFTFAALALAGTTRAHPVPFIVAPIALAPFLLDGTLTILSRLRRREAIWKAHRTHLYQRAVTSGLGHRDVLIVYAAWIALASGMSAPLAAGSLRGGLIAVSAMLACLFAVWKWVTFLELKSKAHKNTFR